jgi:peptide/nickel transport system substrate-binding protein
MNSHLDKQPYRWRKIQVLFALLPLLFLAACNNQGAADEETAVETPTPLPTISSRGSGGTLRLLYWEAPSILNPHLSAGLKDWEASRITYEPLASFDKDGNLVPFLAAAIPSLENGDVAEDGLSVTWRLQPGVRWSDGEPFTAGDVLFTYQYVTNPDVASSSAGSYDTVESVEVVDDTTVTVHFREPNPAWFIPFVGIQGMILPRHIFEEYNGPDAADAPANMLPVGTGPYYVVSFKPQEVLLLGTELIETNKIVYEPNPYFRDPDKPYFSKVELRGGGTVSEAARSVLRDGIVDYAYALQVPAETLAELEAAGVGRVLANYGSTVEMIELNRTDPNQETAEGERSSLQFPHPFFSDLNVRRAIAMALDRERIAELYGLTGQPASNIVVAPTNYVSPNTSLNFDPEAAAALLEAAGWLDSNGDGIREKDGRRFTILLQAPFNPLREQIMAIVKENLAAIGIEVELKLVDAGIFFGDDVTNTSNGLLAYADMQEFDILNLSPDPNLFLQWWTSDQVPQLENGWAGFNSPRWQSVDYDALYQQANTEMNPDLRRDIIIRMNDLLVNDVVMIPLVHQAQISGISLTLEGVELTPWDTDTWRIMDWRRAEP